VAVYMAKLNLQEKRRVEDLVFSEIDTAIREYSSSRHTEYDKLRSKILKNPPAEVKKLREDILKLESQVEQKEQELLKNGFELTRYGERDLTLREHGEYHNQALSAFNEKTDETKRKIEQLKKRCVVMVYADSDEVKGLFDKVSEEITKLVA